MIKDLDTRVIQFMKLELPGQPQMMHLGTSYLVSDLNRAWKEAEARVREAAAQVLTVLERETATIARHDAKLDATEARAERLEKALTPSLETKAAYICEFRFPFPEVYTDDDGEVIHRTSLITVPWDTVKEIMKAIREFAALAKEDQP